MSMVFHVASVAGVVWNGLLSFIQYESGLLDAEITDSTFCFFVFGT